MGIGTSTPDSVLTVAGGIMADAIRLTDGAGAERYTLFEFLSLADLHAFYPILQPTRPNDLGIIKLWEEALKKNGRVDLMLGTEVSSINQTISGDQVVVSGESGRKIDSPPNRMRPADRRSFPLDLPKDFDGISPRVRRAHSSSSSR